MPPRKTAAKSEPEVAEEKVAAAPEPASEPEDGAGPDSAAYADTAASIAAETRALADDTRARIAALQAECDDLGQQDRNVSDAPVWDAVRRVRMATADTARTLDGLTAVAADLAAKTL